MRNPDCEKSNLFQYMLFKVQYLCTKVTFPCICAIIHITIIIIFISIIIVQSSSLSFFFIILQSICLPTCPPTCPYVCVILSIHWLICLCTTLYKIGAKKQEKGKSHNSLFYFSSREPVGKPFRRRIHHGHATSPFQ